MRIPSAPSEQPRPAGLPFLRADDRFVDAFAEVVADQVAQRLEAKFGEEAGFMDAAAAGRYLGTTRKRIHEVTSARILRPDGRDGRRPLFRKASLDRFVEGGSDA